MLQVILLFDRQEQGRERALPKQEDYIPKRLDIYKKLNWSSHLLQTKN
jgi:hypothetical protein